MGRVTKYLALEADLGSVYQFDEDVVGSFYVCQAGSSCHFGQWQHDADASGLQACQICLQILYVKAEMF